MNFNIDYYLSNFHLTYHLEDWMDSDDDYEAKDFLKKLYIYFNSQSKTWIIKPERIEEICAWFDEYKQPYTLSVDAANRLLYLLKHWYKRESRIFREKTFDKTILKKDVIPYDFQVEAINWRLKRSFYLDSYDAGLGKSFINICVFSQLLKEQIIDSVFIVVPTGLTYHWQHEILTFIKEDLICQEDIQLIDNTNKFQPFTNYQNKKILIVPGHLLKDVVLSYKKGWKFGKSAAKLRWKTADYVDIYKEWNKENPVLVVDESHMLKASNTIITKATKSIKKYFDYRFFLSATPAINGIEQIYSQLNLLDTSIIPMSENTFRLWLAEEIGNNYDRYAIVKPNIENVEKLRQSYKPFVSQLLKEDIAEMKAKRYITPLYVELTSAQKVLYKKIIQQFLFRLEQEYDKISWTEVLNKLPLICEVIDNVKLLEKRVYDDEEINKIVSKWKIEFDPKFQLLKSLLNDYVNYRNEKVLIFDWHPETLDTLAEKFKDYNPIVIHGSQKTKNKEKEREEKRIQFNKSEKNRVAFLSALTSAQGGNWQEKCRRVIVYNMPWDATRYRQLIDRTHRIVSNQDTLVEIIVADKTIDNLRVNRNMGRVNYNEKLNKEITVRELRNLIQGMYND
jgi:hypothetical protein